MATATTKITPEMLAATIQKILDEYGDDAVEAITIAGQKTTKETAKAVRANAKGMGWRSYPGSWTSKFTPQRFGFEAVVYSKQPGLQHLLEKGHRITYLGGVKSKGPGRARAFPHIQQVDDQVPEWLESEIRKELNRL